MGLTIIAGGCRYTKKGGKAMTARCDECPSQNACDLEPKARQWAAMMSSQWISTDDLPPPEDTRILYLEYPSELPAGTVRLGCYDGISGSYLEAVSGKILPEQAVVAWMLIPQALPDIYKGRRPAQYRTSGLTVARVLD